MNAPLTTETSSEPRSIVRENLLTREGYSPYCGNYHCYAGMPRTRFNGSQFECTCGWKSAFDAEFIAEYKASMGGKVTAPRSEDERLTRDECLWVAEKLHARARHSSKKLTAAIRNECHPLLIQELRQDIAECTRVATKLQGAT